MLTIEERRSIVDILADLYDFTEGTRARRVLIEQAGLAPLPAQISISRAAPRTVAADLIGRLERFGALPERPTHHALGALLSYVLTLSDVPPDQAKVLAQLVVRYALVGDPRYIGELRREVSDCGRAAARRARRRSGSAVAEAGRGEERALRAAHRGGRGTRARTDHQQRRQLPRPDAAARRALLRRRRLPHRISARRADRHRRAGRSRSAADQSARARFDEPARRRAGALRLLARRSGRRGGGTCLQVQEGFLSRESVGTVTTTRS